MLNLTSSTGTTWWTYSYLPYGGVRSETKNNTQAIDNSLRFAGEYLDPSALYYLRAREYDPASGRFLSVDPVRATTSDPFVSAYAYVRNSPTMGTDPSGKCWPLCFAAVGAVVGAAVGGLAYTATHLGNFSGQEAAGAVLGGAIAGAATAVAGPLGGTIAASAGFGAGGAAAAVATVAIGAAGGAVATEVQSYVGTGQLASPALVLQGALLNGAGGYLAGTMYQTVGIYTAAQAAAFGPHSWGGFAAGVASGATNATAILRQSLASAIWGVGGALYPWNWGQAVSGHGGGK